MEATPPSQCTLETGTCTAATLGTFRRQAREGEPRSRVGSGQVGIMSFLAAYVLPKQSHLHHTPTDLYTHPYIHVCMLEDLGIPFYAPIALLKQAAAIRLEK